MAKKRSRKKKISPSQAQRRPQLEAKESQPYPVILQLSTTLPSAVYKDTELPTLKSTPHLDSLIPVVAEESTIIPTHELAVASTISSEGEPVEPVSGNNWKQDPILELSSSPSEDDFFLAKTESTNALDVVSFITDPLPVKPVSRVNGDLQRQQKLRKAVTSIVGVCTIICLVVGVRLVTKQMQTASAQQPPITMRQRSSAAWLNKTRQNSAQEEKKSEVVEKKESKPLIEPSPSTSANTLTPKSSEEPTSTSKSASADTKQQLKNAMGALERGKLPQAMEQAKAVIDVDPKLAEAYVIWGTALMEQGKQKEAREIFQTCAQKAEGPKLHICKQFK
jgi:hypothetical protein